MAGKFKVYAFGMTALNSQANSLEEILVDIEFDDLESRLRIIDKNPVRIEHIEKSEDGMWLMDFVKLRDVHGPGKASMGSPVQGFEFEEGEVFCEETAALYSPETNHIIIQYNHFGVRHSAIEEYFSSYVESENNIYGLKPKYDDEVDNKFRNRKNIRKLKVGLDPRLLSQKDADAGTALSKAIEIGSESNGATIDITISAGVDKKRFLDRESISGFISKVRGISEQKPDSIRHLEVGIVGDIDSKMQVLDLIAPRLSKIYQDIKLDSDKRWPRKERYNRLLKAYRSWEKKFK